MYFQQLIQTTGARMRVLTKYEGTPTCDISSILRSATELERLSANARVMTAFLHGALLPHVGLSGGAWPREPRLLQVEPGPGVTASVVRNPKAPGKASLPSKTSVRDLCASRSPAT